MSRASPGEIVDENREHASDPDEYRRDCSTDRTREVVSDWVATHVDDYTIASSSKIHRDVDADDVRIQDIGRTLGSRRVGETPEGFLEDVEVGKWRDSKPIKWEFKRVAGEATGQSAGQTLRKPELVREISAALDVDVSEGYHCHHDHETERADIRISWMRAVLRAVATAAGDDIESYLSDEQPEYVDDPVDTLTKLSVSRVLERILDADERLGTSDGWTRSTLLVIHEVLVEGRNPTEVDA
ncbi:hypothetical protein BJ1_gp26 [Halorubrum virus BJ1]|uniref:Uncharacterized protein n=1 Tax=Halorubrum virus BJ1 TaxID=416419 RepID=A0ZYN9_9CAUD|nr:hypothetical protein BJ1_gp26 [Halorubrum virus BJ1]CAL92448.1 hypothetical protein [Halorubrum virus BJ1]